MFEKEICCPRVISCFCVRVTVGFNLLDWLFASHRKYSISSRLALFVDALQLCVAVISGRKKCVTFLSVAR